jgi:outer membrane protein
MPFRMGLRLAPIALVLVCLGKIASAQPPSPVKVAVIDLQRAVLESAEIKKASNDMEAKYKPRAAEIEQLQKDLDGISQQLQNPAKLTPQAQADLQATGQRKQRDIQRMQQDLQSDVDAERNDILSKTSAKMHDVVKKIAEEKGLDLVVDTTNTVYFKAALDITADAITAYDKAYPAK